MEVIARATDYVLGRSIDTGPATGYGVYLGLRAAVEHRLGRDDLRGLKVAIQGLGGVGYHLAKALAHQGASLWVTDTDASRVEAAVEHLGAKAVEPRAIYALDVDVF